MSRYPRHRAGPVDLGGLSASPAMPGASAAPLAVPESPGQQLADALGVVNEAAQAAGRLGRELRYADERQKEYLRGEAATAAAETMPVLHAQITSGEVEVPLNPDELPGWASKLIDDRVPLGMPDTYTKEFRDRTTHAAIALGAAYQQQKFEENRKAGVAAILNGVTGVTDGDRLRAAAGELSATWKVPALTARGMVAQSAMQYAATTTNPEAMTAARAFAGDEFRTEQATAQAAYDLRATHNQALAVSSFKDTISGMYLNGSTFDAIREQAGAMRGIVPDTAIEEEVRTADLRQHQADAEAVKAASVAEKLRVQTEHASDADAKVKAGLGALIEDKRFTTPDGTEHHVARAQAFEDAMGREFGRIARSNLTPEQKFDAQVVAATSNGYVVPAWKRTMESGAIATTEWSVSNPSGALPPTTQAGFALFKQLYAKSPELLAATVDDRTFRLFSQAMAIQQDSHVGSTEPSSDTQALLAARQALSSGSVVSDSMNKQILDAASSMAAGFWTNAKNSGQVAGMIANLAKGYAAGGVNADKAVERAKQEVDARVVRVNGWLVDVAQANVPAQVRAKLPELAQTFINAWAEKHAAEDGYSASDLAVRFNPSNSGWTIVDGLTGVPVPFHGDPETVTTSTARLVTHYTLLTEQRAAAELEAAKQKYRGAAEQNAKDRKPGDVFHGIDYLEGNMGPLQ